MARGIDILTGISFDLGRGIDILTGPDFDRSRGQDININDTLLINVTSSTGGTISSILVITNSTNINGSYTGTDYLADDGSNEYAFIESIDETITIDVSAPGHISQQVIYAHPGEGWLITLDIELVRDELVFSCNQETFLGNGTNLNGKLSTSEETTWVATFPASGTPATSSYRVIMRIDETNGTSDAAIKEIDDSRVTGIVDGDSLVYTVIIDPSETSNDGNDLSARLIEI